MLSSALTATVLSERLSVELADVEARFAAELLSDLSCVNALTAHVERYRGKMLRPMLVLVGGMAASAVAHRARASDNGSPAEAADELSDAHRVVAAVVEMVHMSTLVHDDVLDEADIRRGGPTLNHLRGNEAAVMLGDYLISHAYHLCSSLDLPWVSRAIADATNTVCEGELLQLSHRGNWTLDEAAYFEIIRRKTAALCEVSCRLAARLSAAPGPVVAGLSEYGQKVGVAFQIVDDLLDIVGQERTVGKTLRLDMDKGKATLPLIHHLASASPEDRRITLELLASLAAPPGPNDASNVSPSIATTSLSSTPSSTLGGNGKPHRSPSAEQGQPLERLRQRILSTGSVGYATRQAARLIDEAKTALAPLPDTEAKSLLLSMADAVLTRNF